MADDAIALLLDRWRSDPHGTYQSWFLWDERIKNFRSIRRGLAQVVGEIADGTFGNVYKGSSLEVVVGSIAEQRQIFKGADHAFLWKPKLRIPDIYESPENQRAFGRFLHTCCECNEGAAVIDAIGQLDRLNIKGLGPAAANLLYFLHPTIVPPFNTAIVNGYNALTGSRVKLGRWSEFLAMREGILRLNAQYRSRLSNDLGAIGGFLFDIGAGRYAPPPHNSDESARVAWEQDLQRVREDAKIQRIVETGQAGDRTHTDVQQWLRDLGFALGFRVHVAANDRGRACTGGRLGDGCLGELPQSLNQMPGADAVWLIDVLWIDQSGQVAAGFEVEHSTSIYSGIVRLLDLALGGGAATQHLFLVAPDDREHEVREQVQRPAFRHLSDLRVRYVPYSELEQHRDAIALRFGAERHRSDRAGAGVSRRATPRWLAPHASPQNSHLRPLAVAFRALPARVAPMRRVWAF